MHVNDPDSGKAPIAVALDASLAQEVISNILNYCRQQQITVLAISHDQQLVERHADAVIRISKE